MSFYRSPRASLLPEIGFLVDGKAVLGREGETVAAALAASGILHLRDSPKHKAPRGAFCFAGVCQECAILIEGRLQQACLVRLRPGLRVVLRGSMG